MIKGLRAYLKAVKDVESNTEFSTHADAIIRVALQYAVFALAEWVIQETRASPHRQLTQDIDFQSLRKPTDGTLTQLFIKLVVECENLGLKGMSKIVWAPLNENVPCEQLLDAEPSNLEGLLTAHVRRRNNGAGHGLPGGHIRDAEYSLVTTLLDRIEPVIPLTRAGEASPNFIFPGAAALKLNLLRSFDGSVYLIRQIRSTNTGKCIVKVQVQRSIGEREETTYEAEDVLSAAPELRNQSIDLLETSVQGWQPLASIPEPMTEAFFGRDEEMRELQDWFDYMDSKACLVFGDGGMGKTTLVVEFLSRVIDGTISVAWRPDLIYFYTAKRTRWGLNGLEVINPSVCGASDVALSLARALEGAVGREWYSLQSSEAVARLSTLLGSYGLTRDRSLLVIDNAETLAQSDDDVVALTKTIRELTRYVARVVVTSRRREHVEAQLLEIPTLSEDESELFLRKRGKALDVAHINQAGSSTLKAYARKLGQKPLVLEVFIQSLTEPNTSLERAFSRVQQMQNKDLGEFLYSDAWQRIGAPLRRLLLLMSRVGEVHDEVLLKLCASECGVSVLEAQRAIDESRGIAGISRVGGSLQVTFTPEFMRFCAGRTATLNGKEFPDSAAVDKVGRRYRHFQASMSREVFDKTGMAFRHPLARAAYRAATDGDDSEADAWYELAVGADSSNAALHDRYAYFLMSRGYLERARDRAASAVQLEPQVAEFRFTKGMIESKLGLSRDALQSLSMSQKLGKPVHLCALQMAYAYSKSSPPDYSNARTALMVAREVTPDDPYRFKHLSECDRLAKRIQRF